MSRRLAVRLVLVLLGLAAFYLLWSFAYELAVAFRWNPALPGEGAERLALLKYQNSLRDFSALTVASEHFMERVSHPATQLETLIRGSIAAGAVLALGAGLTVVGYAIRRPAPYGISRFGNLMEAEGKGLTGKKGLVLGKMGNQPIVSNDPAHVLVVGPTRSGKGVSFVVPNGFAWQGSSVWFDPKRENFGIFGAHRKAIGEDVFMFSPGESETHRYNPLDFIRRDERMATDAMVVASFIIPEATGSSEIWAKSARMLLAAMIGHVMSSPRLEGQRHFRSVSRMTTTGEDFQVVLKALVSVESATMPRWVRDSFNQFIGIEKETRNSALFNLNVAMNPWNSGLIAAATETSDFDIRELRRRRMAIFIGCSIAQLDVYRPLIKILVQQIHDVMMANIPGPDEPHQVLVMIDEFRQLGAMESLVSKLTINAGYGFRMVLVLQDVGQLDEVYSKAVRVTTLSACQVKLFIQINDQDTAEYVSDMLGQTTLEIKTPVSRPGSSIFSTEKNIRYEERAFRTPEELRRMKSTKAILLVPNSYGFELTKYRFFADNPFKALVRKIGNLKVKVPSLKVRQDTESLGAAVEPVEKLVVQAEAQTPASTPEPENSTEQRMAEHERANAEVYRARRAAIQPEGGAEIDDAIRPNPPKSDRPAVKAEAASAAPAVDAVESVAAPKAELVPPRKGKRSKIKSSAAPPVGAALIEDITLAGPGGLDMWLSATNRAVETSVSKLAGEADLQPSPVQEFVEGVERSSASA